jgi:hypothetical protein
MRILVVICLVLGSSGAAAPAAAEDAATLRRELDQLRQELDATRARYQQAIDTLTERLQRLEARPRTASAQPAPVPPPAGAGWPSLAQLAQPREPFALAERRGAGQLLFDMGVAGDFVANLTSRRAEDAAAGTFAGRENRLFPREIELSLFGQIDPFARGEVRIEAAEEFEDDAREVHVGLAEAHLTLLTLPLGTQLKLGQMRSRFGLLNQIHQHDLPQIDRPNVLTRFFGEEQLVESGAELSWLAPLPVYLEAVAGLFNGDNEEAFGRGSLRDPLVTGRLRTFLELGERSGLQLGVSGATGQTPERERASYLGVDVKYKHTPAGWRHALVTVGGEAIFGNRKVPVEAADGADAGDLALRGLGQEPGEGDAAVEFRRRHPWGFYTYAELQPWRRWLFGARYDWTDFVDETGDEWAVQPYLAFMPSEFLRFRLAYKHTDRSGIEAGPRTLDELFFQATFVLGAHPAHPF